MWISEESSTRSNIDWLRTHYPDSARFSSMIFEDEEDVLRPEVVRAMYRVRTAVDSLVTPVHGDRWRDLCQPIPVVKPPNLVRQMRSNIDDIFYLENRCSNFFWDINVVESFFPQGDIFGFGGRKKKKKKRSDGEDTPLESSSSSSDFDDFTFGDSDFFSDEDEDFDTEEGFFDSIDAVDNLEGEEEKEEPGIE